jgi:hypothetical protein
MEFMSILTNLSAEYPAFLDFIFLAFAVIGIMISASAVIAIIKLGDKNNELVTPGSHILWKLFAGPSLVNLALLARAWGGTLWANSDPLDIGQYSGSGTGWDAAVMAAVGIMVLAGYITLGRAYMMMSKLGTVSIDARGDLMGSIFARIIAGSALIFTIHIAQAIEASSGFGFFS